MTYAHQDMDCMAGGPLFNNPAADLGMALTLWPTVLVVPSGLVMFCTGLPALYAPGGASDSERRGL